MTLKGTLSVGWSSATTDAERMTSMLQGFTEAVGLTLEETYRAELTEGLRRGIAIQCIDRVRITFGDGEELVDLSLAYYERAGDAEDPGADAIKSIGIQATKLDIELLVTDEGLAEFIGLKPAREDGPVSITVLLRPTADAAEERNDKDNDG